MLEAFLLPFCFSNDFHTGGTWLDLTFHTFLIGWSPPYFPTSVLPRLFLSLCLMNNPVIAAKLQTTLADRLLQCCGQCGPNCSTDRLYTKLSIWCTLASNFRRFLGCKLIPSSSTLFHMSQDALWCPCNLALWHLYGWLQARRWWQTPLISSY